LPKKKKKKEEEEEEEGYSKLRVFEVEGNNCKCYRSSRVSSEVSPKIK
jgi:hypothetical protein